MHAFQAYLGLLEVLFPLLLINSEQVIKLSQLEIEAVLVSLKRIREDTILACVLVVKLTPKLVFDLIELSLDWKQITSYLLSEGCQVIDVLFCLAQILPRYIATVLDVLVKFLSLANNNAHDVVFLLDRV